MLFIGSLSFALLNVRSILHKSIDIAELIIEHNVDFIALTETWHSSSEDISLNKAAPTGFLIIDMAHAVGLYIDAGNSNHGGVAFIYRSIFIARRFYPLISLQELLNYFICSVHNGTSKIIFNIIYKPSS